MEWISVEDRLPSEEELHKSILVYCSKGIHTARFFSQLTEAGTVGGWECCNYCGGESKVTFNNATYTESKITHWMPLPTPPKPQPCD